VAGFAPYRDQEKSRQKSIMAMIGLESDAQDRELVHPVSCRLQRAFGIVFGEIDPPLANAKSNGRRHDS
jgi:hypothetical protein